MGQPSGAADMGEIVSGHCSYTNPFSMQMECREYVGADWTAAGVMSDCKAQSGLFAAGLCNLPSVLGRCLEHGDTAKVTRVVLPGTDAMHCAEDQRGCETFAGGKWIPDTLCGGK